MRNKEVQVIPWVISDSNFLRSPSGKLVPQKTVFVGALHGMLTAEGLCNIFNDLFGGVVYAGKTLDNGPKCALHANSSLGVDTDKYKYPIGSGRVTFNNSRSYMKAVSAAFIEIKTAKFTKKVTKATLRCLCSNGFTRFKWIPTWRTPCAPSAASDKAPTFAATCLASNTSAASAGSSTTWEEANT